MGTVDEFLQDDLDDEKTIEFIKNYLPQDLKEKFSDDELYYFLDVIDEYYVESGILDAQPDKDGYIDIDLEKIVDYIIKEARKDEMGEYDPEELLLSFRVRWNIPTHWAATNKPTFSLFRSCRALSLSDEARHDVFMKHFLR